MKRLGWIVLVVLLSAAYVAGYWYQFQRSREAQENLTADLKAASLQLAGAESRIRLCKLQNDLIALAYKTADKNYGDALSVSSRFFDQVLAEATRTENQKWKSSLESILQKRDAVTAALAKGEPSALELLLPMEKTLHQLVEAGGSETQPAARP